MEQAYPGRRVIRDVGSGLNFKRPGLLALLDAVNRGKIGSVAVCHRDRLCRFAFDLVAHLFDRAGTQLVVHDSSLVSRDEELADDLLSVVQVFCCRRNGKRRYARHAPAEGEAQSHG